MTCIDKILIQKYIDGELSEEDSALINNHLVNCKNCVQAIEKQRLQSNRIKALIGQISDENVEIPPFINKGNEKKVISIIMKTLLYGAVAACLAVIFCNRHQNTNQELEYYYSFDSGDEYNANLPMTDQDMEIQIFDSNGKLMNY